MTGTLAAPARRRAVGRVLLPLLATTLLASLVAAPSAQAGPAVVVSGRVVDTDGRPVAGVLVAAVPAEELWQNASPLDDRDRETVTGADGRFELRAPVEGRYAVRACPTAGAEDGEEGGAGCMAPEEAPPYLRAYVGDGAEATSWVALPRLLESAAGPREVGDVELARPSRIEGRLRHANVQQPGSGTAPELVVLRRLDGTQVGYRFLRSEYYDFTGLAPGRYRVESSVQQLQPRRFRSEVVELGPQETRRVDATLSRPVQMSGRVTASGRPLPREEVVLVRDGEEVARALTDQAGEYVLRSDRPGRYVVRTTAEDSPYLPAATAATTLREGAHARRGLAVSRGASVRLAVPAAEGGILHRLRDGRGRAVAGDLVDGPTIRYQGLAPGRYTTTVIAGGRYTRRSFEVQGRGVLDLGRVRLDRRTLTWTGTTTPGSLVELSDVRDLDDERFVAATPETPFADARGRFRAAGIVPGEYRVVVRPQVETGRAPRVLPRVALRSDLRRDLAVPRGGTVSGRLVRDVDGSAFDVPLAVEAAHRGENRRFQFPFGVAGLDGRFVVTSLMDGVVDVSTNIHEGTQHEYWEVGSPYFVEHDPVSVRARVGAAVDVGDVRLRVGGGPLVESGGSGE